MYYSNFTFHSYHKCYILASKLALVFLSVWARFDLLLFLQVCFFPSSPRASLCKTPSRRINVCFQKAENCDRAGRDPLQWHSWASMGFQEANGALQMPFQTAFLCKIGSQRGMGRKIPKQHSESQKNTAESRDTCGEESSSLQYIDCKTQSSKARIWLLPSTN